MDSDKLDRDFEHEGTAYTGKLRKQEGGGGWMFKRTPFILPVR